MELQEKYLFAAVEVRVVGDLLLLEAHGGLSVESARQLVELFRLMVERHGQFFMLGDLKDGGPMPPAVRRLIAELAPAHGPAALAFYGGNLAIRATNALLMSAIKTLGGPGQNVTYFPTGEEAREWLAAERQRLTGRASPAS